MSAMTRTPSSLFAARFATAAFCLALGLVATPAQAEEVFFELGVNSAYPLHESYDALSDDNYLASVNLGAGMDLGQLLLPGLRTYFLIDAGGRTQSRFDGVMDLTWQRTAFMGALDYGMDFGGFLRPSVRLAGGYALQYLEVQTRGPEISDYAHDLVVQPSVGLEFYVPYTDKSAGALFNTFTFGVTGRFGYMIQTNATFDELAAEEDAYGKDDPWIRSDGNFGTLDVDGLFWNLGLVVRWRL